MWIQHVENLDSDTIMFTTSINSNLAIPTTIWLIQIFNRHIQIDKEELLAVTIQRMIMGAYPPKQQSRYHLHSSSVLIWEELITLEPFAYWASTVVLHIIGIAKELVRCNCRTRIFLLNQACSRFQYDVSNLFWSDIKSVTHWLKHLLQSALHDPFPLLIYSLWHWKNVAVEGLFVKVIQQQTAEFEPIQHISHIYSQMPLPHGCKALVSDELLLALVWGIL